MLIITTRHQCPFCQANKVYPYNLPVAYLSISLACFLLLLLFLLAIVSLIALLTTLI